MCLRTLLFILVLITNLLSCFCETNRHIECVVYTDSQGDKQNLSVIYITATGDQDKVHYIWSSHNLPSVIISRTTKDTTLNKIDFDKLWLFESGAIKFSKKPLASTGFTITELWQNSYGSDASDINDVSEVVPLGLEDFEWKNVINTSISCSKGFARINLVSSGDEDVFSKGGTFEIEFSVSGREESASDYPHLIYSGNSTQLKVVFNKFYSNSTRIRYAMEVSVFAPLSKKCDYDECKTVVTKSVSDEFSPGIFSDITLLPPCSHDSFLSWRPVAYTSKEPSVANSTNAKVTSKCSKSVEHHIKSIAELFFNDTYAGDSSVSMFNMTFGTKLDGFYTKTEYTMWSFMAGVGSSVGFKISASAIIIMCIGFGALSLFLVSGLIFSAVQRCRRKDDEWLLNESVN